MIQLHMISRMAGLNRNPLNMSLLGSREDGGADMLNIRPGPIQYVSTKLEKSKKYFFFSLIMS
jgi:hypothetical protein